MPPTFFNIMLHFVVYFVEEVEPRGPVQARWLYLLEMYMKDLKNDVGQKTYLEGSMDEVIWQRRHFFCEKLLTLVDLEKKNA